MEKSDTVIIAIITKLLTVDIAVGGIFIHSAARNKYWLKNFEDDNNQKQNWLMVAETAANFVPGWSLLMQLYLKQYICLRLLIIVKIFFQLKVQARVLIHTC